MRDYLKALTVVIIILCAAKAHSQDEVSQAHIRTFDLKEAISTAIMNNRAIQIQENEVEFARADIMYARSKFMPQLSAGYDYTYNDSVSNTASLPPPFGGTKKDTRIFTGYKSDNLFTVSLEESIYNGGANIANLEQAKVNLKMQRETLRAARLTVEFETKRLFYGLLLAYETERIAKDLVEQAEAHYEEVRMMYEQGTASKFDLLQSKVQVARLIPQLVNAENAIQLIMAEFKKLLTIDMRSQIELKGKLACEYIDIKDEEFLHEAYQNKPEMKLRLLGIDLKRWGIEFARAGWLPQVSIGGGYSVRSNDIANMFNSRHDNWNIGVRTSIAVFDGFATKAQVDEAKAKYSQAVLEKDDIIDQIAVDVKDACLNLMEARAIIESQEASIVEAKEALRLAEVRFDNGVGINLDVFDAQVGLAQVEQNLAQGIYDYIMAKAQLDKTMGREFFKEG